MSSEASLDSGTPVRLSIPQLQGHRRTLDGVLATVDLPWVEMLLATSASKIGLEIQDIPWYLTHELADCVIAHQVNLVEQLQPKRWRLEILNSTCHRITRRSERIEAQVTIRNFAESPLTSGASPDSEQTITLNSEGLSFTTSRQLRADQVLELDLQFPGERPGRMRIAGKVIRVTPVQKGRFLVALSFTHLSRANRENLRRLFITRHFHDLNARIKLLGNLFSPTLNR